MHILEIFADPKVYIMLLTLAAMEIVLGIDNIVFITIITGRLPRLKQPMVRRLGIGLALVSRIGLLFGISWVLSLENVLFHAIGQDWNGKELILLAGGLFLLGKATHEIYENVERPEDHQARHLTDTLAPGAVAVAVSIPAMIVQIVLLDIVFSIDSVVTAVGMLPADKIPVMIAAMIIAVVVMLIFAGPLSDFVDRHASIKILALAFLVLIGVMLVLDAFNHHISKGYIYFSMAFSLVMQLLNMRMASRRERIARRTGVLLRAQRTE